ncbi:MAG: hypothetical protein ACRD3K_02785, partial [Edaphobacter sp.]
MCSETPRLSTQSPHFHHPKTTQKTPVFAETPAKTSFHHSKIKLVNELREKRMPSLVKRKQKAQAVLYLRCFMALPPHRSALLAGFLALSFSAACAQVFTVGEKSATADITTDFTPTRVPLPSTKLTERGRRELIRNLEAEQGFAHRALPVSAGITLQANGQLTPGPAEYRKLIYEKGQSAAPGDRVVITSMEIKGDRIVLDFNGGPYAKHRFLRHIQLNDAPVSSGDLGDTATGSRITLVFEGGVPEISGPEVKALLQPLIDFGVKSSEQAYADTLPPALKDAIAAHEVLVG